MTSIQRNEELGALVPFPGAATSPTITRAGDVEVVADEQHQRVRRRTEYAMSRLPARWHDRDQMDRVRAKLVRQAVRAPFRYPPAVARGLVVAARAWWMSVSVQDFYEAAKQTQ